jgi:phage head maturation protease
MAQRIVTRDMPQLSFRASFEPSTVNAEKRTVQLTWTTGAAVLRGFFDRYFEELSLEPSHVRMQRLQSGSAPLLNNHNRDTVTDVIGVVESADLGRKRGVATVRFDTGPEGEDAFRKVREGILRNVSVGYRTYKMQKVEGGDATIPTYRAVDWEPYEISMVAISADAGAVTRSGGPTTPCEFVDEERTMADPVTPIVTTPAQPVAPAAPAASTTDQVRALERARVIGIQRRGASLERPQSEIDDAIAAGTTLDAFTAAAVDARANDKKAKNGPSGIVGAPPAITSGEDQRDKTSRGMTAWLIQRSGQARLVAAATRERPDLMTPLGAVDADPGEFRGMTLVDMARRCLEAANVRTAGMSRMELVGAALTMREVAGSGITATTGDFPNILENILYKVLLAQYAVTPDTWRIFCKVGSVSDFRVNKRYRMGTFGSLDALNELGEFKNKSIPDAEKQSLTASTKGNIIGISRQAIINDDMSAFDTLATMFGRAAALSIEVDVYAQLALNSGLGPVMTDGNTLFHATHNNITTGAAIGAAAIDADRVAMASQKDPSGNEILALRPTTLLLPVGLGGTARQINNSQYDFDTSNKFQIANRVGGLFQQIVDTPRITGTRRYLFADPGVAPTLEVAFVDGQQQPFMDMQQGWRVDGVEWKVREDYGVAAIDFRGAITNAGA